MITNLKLCPLCKSRANEIMGGVTCECSNVECRLHEPMSIDEWQYRPVEDELQKQLDKCEYELNETQKKLSRAQSKLDSAADVFAQIAKTKITIILEDGTEIRDGELAMFELENIRYE